MPPKKAAGDGKAKAVDAKAKTAPKPTKKISSKKITLPEDTLSTSVSVTTDEPTTGRQSSSGGIAGLTSTPEPALQQSATEQQPGTSEQAAPELEADAVTADAEAVPVVQAEPGQQSGPDADGAAAEAPAAPQGEETGSVLQQELPTVSEDTATEAVADITDPSALGESADAADLSVLPADGLSAGADGLLNPSQAATESLISAAADQLDAPTSLADGTPEQDNVAAGADGLAAENDDVVEDEDSQEAAERASMAAAVQQELAKQAQLKAAHTDLERRLKQVFAQRGSVPHAEKDNMHMATQATRYTSLLSAWQARTSDKASMAQAHAAHMASLAPLIGKKQETIVQLQSDFKAMVETAGHGAISSKTGHLLGGKVVQQALAGMQAKQEQLRTAQLAFLQTQAWLKAIQARVTAQESFSGGLGLMDLEQLQLEKAGLLIKLAGRDHEMAKFLHKRREVVQILAHVQCKLYQQRKVHQSLQAQVTSATGVLNHHRAVAAAAKVAAQQAAEKAARARERDTTLHDARLVEHYQTQLLHREHLQHKMLEVSGKLSRTLLSISPNNILPPDCTLIPAKVTGRTLAALQAQIEAPHAQELGPTEELLAT